MRKNNLPLKAISLLCLTFILLLIPSKLYGQIAINKLNDLSFGSVFKGYSSQLQDTDNGAAIFTFTTNTAQNANVEIRFSLPNVLKYSSYTIPITFDASHSSWSFNNSLNGRTHFDPNAPLTLSNLSQQNNVYIWLGGTITPSANIVSGPYTGTITLTVDIL